MSPPHIVGIGAGRGSLKSYAAGFLLSIILTAAAFGWVATGAGFRASTLAVIFGAAIVQILVHLHCFLHLRDSSAMRWNVLALIFTVLIMALFVGGTLWIMSHLQYRGV
jgi:cytochrome o ubiquinol oxidase operon protein cyoD